ncbi:MAG TPA: peptidoglycan-binding protein, partial [Rhodoferax sp.]|nr:peptidoglycan-binding protein [Rhodoferax sp.]
SRSVVDKAAAEVFGPEPSHAQTSGRQRMGYALAGLALLAALVLLVLQLGSGQKGPQQTTQAASTARAVPPKAAASTPPTQPVAALPVAQIESLQTLWPQLPADIDSAWRALAPDWKLPDNSADPCLAAGAQGLQCYSASKLTMPLLRQLNRPGILTLQAAQGPAVHALLVGLSDQTATLRLDGRLHTVRLIELAQFWRGDFASYWQVPQGYNTGLQEGSTGPAIDWLASRLNLLDGGPSAGTAAVPLALDADLRARVRAFQRARGITPDGRPGPMTFMQIESATQSQAARLLTEPR